MMTFEDHFSSFAPDYARARPVYPSSLYAFLAQQVPAHRLAWDCATGNGQCAIGLTPYFQRVIATDASQDMIDHAISHPQVEYAVALAEEPPLEEAAVDLITVAQAIHWFDLDRFFAEARRILKPGGVIAFWGYTQTHFSPEISEVIGRLNEKYLNPFWANQIRLIGKEGYNEIPFPFEEIAVPEFSMETRWNLQNFVDYLRTWSAVQAYQKERGEDPVQKVGDDLREAWGDPETPKNAQWELFIRAGKKTG